MSRVHVYFGARQAESPRLIVVLAESRIAPRNADRSAGLCACAVRRTTGEESCGIALSDNARHLNQVTKS